MKIPTLAALLVSCVALTRAQSPSDIKGFAPVSVSSANYRETSYDEMRQMVNSKNALNPAPQPLKPLAAPKYFIFAPGETFEADLDYPAVRKMLTATLAKKNFINAADDQDRVTKDDMAKVTLMLRVSYGVSLWRNPVVRTEHITWEEGMVGKVHDPRSLTHLGGTVAYDSRAGGNDDALNAMAQNDANKSSFWGSGGGAATGPGGTADVVTLNTTSPSMTTSYDSTREFNLIVVDAFDLSEVKSKGKYARALWTTFVAAPVQRGQKFSDVLPTMLKSATPFWGDTTNGMQVYNDARAEVKIGQMVEVKDTPPEKK